MKKKILATITIAAMLIASLAACSSGGETTTAAATEAETTVNETTAEETTAEKTTSEATTESGDESQNTEMFTDRDYETEYDADATITLKDNGSTVKGDGAKVSENTITISEKGTYVFTGNLTDGQIVVDAEEAKVQIVLDGAEISNADSACIYVVNADKVFVTTTKDSENSLETTGEFVQTDDTNVDGVIFSKDDICFNGLGTLKITSNTGHGIVAKDDFKATSGTYIIGAASKSIDANDSVRIAGGDFTLTAGTDAIHVENTEDTEKGYVYICGGTFDIISSSDAIDATGLVTIDDGDFIINAGDDGMHSEIEMVINGGNIDVEKCYEGLEAVTITINDGDIYIVSDDDGLNANGNNSLLTINGGTTELIAKGDGADSNGTMNVNGGTLLVSGPENNGNGSLDFEYSGTITGGTVVAAGSTGMAMNFGSESTQPSFLCSFTSSHQSGETITVTDSTGKEIVSYTPSLQYSCVVISTPDLTVGETYTVTAGSETESIEMTDTIVGGTYGFGGGMQGGPGFIGGGGQGGGGMQPGGGQGGGGMQPGGGQGDGGMQQPGNQQGGGFTGGNGQPGMQTVE